MASSRVLAFVSGLALVFAVASSAVAGVALHRLSAVHGVPGPPGPAGPAGAVGETGVNGVSGTNLSGLAVLVAGYRCPVGTVRDIGPDVVTGVTQGYASSYNGAASFDVQREALTACRIL